MNNTQLQTLVEEATKRIIQRINRSAGQHKRQMMTGWRKRQISNQQDKK